MAEEYVFRRIEERLRLLEAGGGPAGYQPLLVSGTNIKTVNGSSLLGSGNLTVDSAPTFEIVSKNLRSVDFTQNYTGDVLTSITYDDGIVKTLNYDVNGDLVSVTLSGATPSGIALTKNIITGEYT